jgi:hypothetical protein
MKVDSAAPIPVLYPLPPKTTLKPKSVSELSDLSGIGIKLYSVINSEDAFSTFIESNKLYKKKLADLDLFLKESGMRYLADRLFFISDYIDTCERLAKIYLEKKHDFFKVEK